MRLLDHHPTAFSGLSAVSKSVLCAAGVPSMAAALAMTDADLLALPRFSRACLAEVRGHAAMLRTDRLRDAVYARIRETGDAPIRTRRQTVAVLLRQVGCSGLAQSFEQPTYIRRSEAAPRERIDHCWNEAAVLEALCDLAVRG